MTDGAVIPVKPGEEVTMVAPMFGHGATLSQVNLLGVNTPTDEVKERTGPGGTKLSYVDARFVMDRFDLAVGPANWARKHFVDGNGNVGCKVGVLVRYEEATEPVWVWKEDIGTESSIESIKGQYSDSFKRAAVNWGCARDLYDEKSEARSKSGPVPSGSASASGGGLGRAAFSDTDPDPDWSCPEHGGRRVVPAGVSKAGKPYPAFAVCAIRECEQKPARRARPVRKPRVSEIGESMAEGDAFVGIGDEV